MGLQTPSTPSIPSLTPLLGTLCSVQWFAANICLCICQALAGPLRRQPYQAPVSKHFLASTIVSGFSDCIWDESPGGLSFSLCSTLYLHICSCENVVLLLRRTKVSTLWSSFFLSFMFSVNCILVIWSFWASIHLPVSAYHVFSFVFGLPHSGWYFLVLSICLRRYFLVWIFQSFLEGEQNTHRSKYGDKV